MIEKINTIGNSAANLFLFLEVVLIAYLLPGAVKNYISKLMKKR